MWLLVSFDIPSEHGYSYRRLRKFLISRGFSFVQKSFCWRWVATVEKMETLQSAIQRYIPPGKLLFMRLPDQSFSQSLSWEDGKNIAMPSPPDPWKIL